MADTLSPREIQRRTYKTIQEAYKQFFLNFEKYEEEEAEKVSREQADYVFEDSTMRDDVLHHLWYQTTDAGWLKFDDNGEPVRLDSRQIDKIRNTTMQKFIDFYGDKTWVLTHIKTVADRSQAISQMGYSNNLTGWLCLDEAGEPIPISGDELDIRRKTIDVIHRVSDEQAIEAGQKPAFSEKQYLREHWNDSADDSIEFLHSLGIEADEEGFVQLDDNQEPVLYHGDNEKAERDSSTENKIPKEDPVEEPPEAEAPAEGQPETEAPAEPQPKADAPAEEQPDEKTSGEKEREEEAPKGEGKEKEKEKDSPDKGADRESEERDEDEGTYFALDYRTGQSTEYHQATVWNRPQDFFSRKELDKPINMTINGQHVSTIREAIDSIRDPFNFLQACNAFFQSKNMAQVLLEPPDDRINAIINEQIDGSNAKAQITEVKLDKHTNQPLKGDKYTKVIQGGSFENPNPPAPIHANTPPAPAVSQEELNTQALTTLSEAQKTFFDGQERVSIGLDLVGNGEDKKPEYHYLEFYKYTSKEDKSVRQGFRLDHKPADMSMVADLLKKHPEFIPRIREFSANEQALAQVKVEEHKPDREER